MGEGDMLTEEQEWVQMSTIDNLLFAATFGCRKAYLEEGSYRIDWNKNHRECHLVISPAEKNGYSLMGIINSRLFYSMTDVTVGTLYRDAVYHVYIEYENGLETDAQCFSVKAYLDMQKGSNRRMYLCAVDTHGEGNVATDVDKVYAKNILSHTMDSTNPHGRIQTQDVMNVTNSLSVHGNPVNGASYASARSAGNGNSVDVEFESEPCFLTIYPEEQGAGEISWKIDGKKAVIRNSGGKGITLNIRADLK